MEGRLKKQKVNFNNERLISIDRNLGDQTEANPKHQINTKTKLSPNKVDSRNTCGSKWGEKKKQLKTVNQIRTNNSENWTGSTDNQTTPNKVTEQLPHTTKRFKFT